MIYIDSDGVLSDFDQWLLDKKCKDHNNSIEVYKTTIEYADEAFLASKPIKENNWLRNIMKIKDFRILTSLPNKKDFRELFESDEKFEECYNKLKENKYLWFERIGVPRDKVIIVPTRRDKFKYCKSSEDILYDDFPDTVKTWKDYGGKAYLIKNNKSKAQKERYQFYALKNFDNVKQKIREGLKRYYLSEAFKKYYPVKDEYDCLELAELDTNYIIKEYISNNIFYNPYSGKIFFENEQIAHILVKTGSNNVRYLDEYLYNCFPILFGKPRSKKMETPIIKKDIEYFLDGFIPKDVDLKIKKLY